VIELSREAIRGAVIGCPNPTEGWDVWALGRVLAKVFELKGEALVGPGVYLKSGPVITHTYEETPQPLNKRSLEHVIWRMLRKDPEQRITSKELSELDPRIYDTLSRDVAYVEDDFERENVEWGEFFGEELSELRARSVQGFPTFPDAPELLNMSDVVELSK
jgi:serine/threonine protein kinase